MKIRALLSAAAFCTAASVHAQAPNPQSSTPPSAHPAASSTATSAPAPAAAAPASARAQLRDSQGQPVGEVTFTETPHGTLIHATLSKLPPGEHAFHVHEVGKCESPFK